MRSLPCSVYQTSLVCNPKKRSWKRKWSVSSRLRVLFNDRARLLTRSAQWKRFWQQHLLYLNECSSQLCGCHAHFHPAPSNLAISYLSLLCGPARTARLTNLLWCYDERLRTRMWRRACECLVLFCEGIEKRAGIKFSSSPIRWCQDSGWRQIQESFEVRCFCLCERARTCFNCTHMPALL